MTNTTPRCFFVATEINTFTDLIKQRTKNTANDIKSTIVSRTLNTHPSALPTTRCAGERPGHNGSLLMSHVSVLLAPWMAERIYTAAEVVYTSTAEPSSLCLSDGVYCASALCFYETEREAR